MVIGPYVLPNNVFAAPMAGVTDRPFRRLCKALGAGYAVSEMAASNPRLWASEKTARRLNHDGERAPVAVQLAGADAQMLAEAARYNVDRGAQIIDINMGCPAKKVCNVAGICVAERRVAGGAHPGGGGRRRRRAGDVEVSHRVGRAQQKRRRDCASGSGERDCRFNVAWPHAAVWLYRSRGIPDDSRGQARRHDSSHRQWGHRHAGKGQSRTRRDGGRRGDDWSRSAGPPMDFPRDRALSGNRLALPPPRVDEVRALLLDHLDDHYRITATLVCAPLANTSSGTRGGLPAVSSFASE